jgi:hypothetical protein
MQQSSRNNFLQPSPGADLRAVQVDQVDVVPFVNRPSVLGAREVFLIEEPMAAISVPACRLKNARFDGCGYRWWHY